VEGDGSSAQDFDEWIAKDGSDLSQNTSYDMRTPERSVSCRSFETDASTELLIFNQ
jgi:hypothetical protein